MKKTMIRLLTGLCLALGLWVCVPGASAEEISTPVMTENLAGHNYINASRWATVSNSALMYDENTKTYTRVEYVGSYVTVETYDSDYTFLGGKQIEMELPIYGGFHNGEEYNFLIFGQENPEEDDSVEVIRVVKYSKDWERLDCASLCGANTTVPFEAGGLSTAEYNGYLYIRTSHKMYASSDGTNHQANLTMNVRIEDMEVTDSFYGVMNVRYGYVSHSFNQFIRVDEDGTLVAVDHGDANPRSVVLTRYYDPAGQDKFTTLVKESLENGAYTYVCAENVDVLAICGESGDNDTGVSVGGFEISDSSYLVVGTSVSQDEETYDASGLRNVFLTVTDKEDLTTKTIILHENNTTYNHELMNPFLVKIDSNKFLVLWGYTSRNGYHITYRLVDGQGNYLTMQRYQELEACDTALSDCQPIVVDGKVVWYMTGSSRPTFCSIDLETEAFSESHFWYYYASAFPTDETGGELCGYCYLCGLEQTWEMPALDSEEYTIYEKTEPTCESSGKTTFLWCSPLGDWLTFSKTFNALGHDYGELTLPEGATCGGYVDYYKVCARCGNVATESIYYAHDYQQVVIEPTCTENGEVILQCTRCGDVHSSYTYGYSTGHDWGDWILCGQPCQGTGYQIRTCANCGETERQDVFGYEGEHSYVDDDSVVDCEEVCKWCGQKRGHRYSQIYGIDGLYQCYDCDTYFLLENGEYVVHVHQFGDWVVDVAPTQQYQGQEVRHCACGMGEMRFTPALSECPFTDVKYGKFYYDAVLWAVDNGITTGKTDTEFAPNDFCTRDQVVTFLWRAAGSPEPTSTYNPFTDVKESDYYYKAVLWAVEKGITKGMTDDTFGPKVECTRGHVVTFLWRSQGEPTSQGKNIFTDVSADKYYYDAVLWAVENEVTKGATSTTFAPGNNCTRGQIVTFLYRTMAEE